MSDSAMNRLRISLDSSTLDKGIGKRKLQSIEPDGRLTYDDGSALMINEDTQKLNL
jgi:hypothetical protein